MKVAIIGAGGLGGSLVRGLRAAGVALNVADLEEKKLEVASGLGANTFTNSAEAAVGCEAVVLCVKPHAVAPVLRATELKADQLLISCAAGVGLAAIEPETEARAARAMPNIGAAVSASTTALCLGSRTKVSDTETMDAIFNAIGDVVWLAKEEQMHAATAVGGSGPAFALVALEAMEDAGVAAGLSREVARSLSRGSLKAAALLLEEGGHPADLRARVTSPGGTTAAGLRDLEAGGGRSAFAAAVAAAVARSQSM